MDYDIKIIDVDPVRVAVMRYNGPVTKAAKLFPNIFKAIKGKSNGAPFLSYHSVDENTGIGEMEVCVPTAESPNDNGLIIKNLPRSKALCLTHIGGYDKLPSAYEIMKKYIEDNRYKVQPPWREVYIKGPGLIIKGNPDKYITEIIFPIEEVENNVCN